MENTIGIFDSGVGGLTVLDHLLTEIPNLNYLYIADEKYFPYGNKSKEELLKCATRIINYFKEQNIKTIAIACNTVSSTILKALKEQFNDLNIIGVVEPTIKEVLKYDNKNILVMATPNTIKTNIYKTTIEKKSNNKVYNLPTPELARLIEENSQSLEAELKKYIQAYDFIDIIVLGCTHYKLIEEKLHKITNKKIICSSETLSNEINKYIKNIKEEGQKQIYTTGELKEFNENCLKIINKEAAHLDL